MDGNPEEQNNDGNVVVSTKGTDAAASPGNKLETIKYIMGALKAPFVTLLEEALWRSREVPWHEKSQCLSLFRRENPIKFWCFFVVDLLILIAAVGALLFILFQICAAAYSFKGALVTLLGI